MKSIPLSEGNHLYSKSGEEEAPPKWVLPRACGQSLHAALETKAGQILPCPSLQRIRPGQSLQSPSHSGPQQHGRGLGSAVLTPAVCFGAEILYQHRTELGRWNKAFRATWAAQHRSHLPGSSGPFSEFVSGDAQTASPVCACEGFWDRTIQPKGILSHFKIEMGPGAVLVSVQGEQQRPTCPGRHCLI